MYIKHTLTGSKESIISCLYSILWLARSLSCEILDKLLTFFSKSSECSLRIKPTLCRAKFRIDIILSGGFFQEFEGWCSHRNKHIIFPVEKQTNEAKFHRQVGKSMVWSPICVNQKYRFLVFTHTQELYLLQLYVEWVMMAPTPSLLHLHRLDLGKMNPIWTLECQEALSHLELY